MENFIVHKKLTKDLSKAEIDEMYSLLTPYYLNPADLFNRELNHNSHAYLVSCQNKIKAFFMVSWNENQIGLNGKKIVYLGLSCSDIGSSNQNLASKAYLNFTVDAYNFENENNLELILYGTTATPVILLVLPKFWDRVKPAYDGSFDAEDKEIIEKIKTSVNLDDFSTSHPFVLKEQGCNTKYSQNEEKRLNSIETKFKLTLFKKLGIDENKGDRLLILCSVPSIEKIEALKINFG